MQPFEFRSRTTLGIWDLHSNHVYADVSYGHRFFFYPSENQKLIVSKADEKGESEDPQGRAGGSVNGCSARRTIWVELSLQISSDPPASLRGAGGGSSSRDTPHRPQQGVGEMLTAASCLMAKK